ncbi:MAG: hypothetical protein HPY83_04800 [Anaerolineae bacterium]|nr:hypothetical protein [Anaerolineae bacterium]
MDYDRRGGCLGGIIQLLLLSWLFDWLQQRFGFGRGCSCTGIGCGLIMLLVFLLLACNIITGTDWFRLTQVVLPFV